MEVKIAQLVLSVITALIAHVCYIRDKKCFYGWSFIIYGWVGVVYFSAIMLDSRLGHTLSPIRTSVQMTIVAAQLLAWTFLGKRS